MQLLTVMSDVFSFCIPDSMVQLHCNSHLINSSQSSLSTQVQHWVIKMRHGSSPTSLCVTGVWQWCWHKPICMCNSAKVSWQHFLSCNSHLKSLVDLRSRVYCQSEGEFIIHVNEQTKKKAKQAKKINSLNQTAISSWHWHLFEHSRVLLVLA